MCSDEQRIRNGRCLKVTVMYIIEADQTVSKGELKFSENVSEI